MSNMLTIDEVKSYLEIEEKELERYLAQGKIHAYKIGGTYLRFRKEEVESLHYQIKSSAPKRNRAERTWLGAAADFWRFNNFYIVSLLIVIAAVYWMVSS